jgi:TonB-dependent starch-binding outer membrane protein SusC
MEKFNTKGRFLPGRFLHKLFLTMRITFFLIVATTLTTLASVSYSQSTRVSLNLRNVTVKDALKAIETKSEFFFIYNNELIDVNRKVNIKETDQRIDAILSALFAGYDIDVDVIDRKIVLAPSDIATAVQQQRGVSGTVTDRTGATLPGVTVFVKGTTTGTITDANGIYTLGNIPPNATLVFSFVGMRVQELEVGTQSVINVSLQEETFGIEEVIAIGYGTQKKRDIIGSISTISSEDIIKAASASSFDAALQGMAPGLMVSSESGIPGAPVQVKIRGVSSISSGTNPLWIVDGIPIVSESMGRSFDGESSQNVLSLINTSDIESIQVLKDAAATSIYGSRGSNGVILVTTKSGKKGLMSFNVDLKSGVSNWANRDIGLASGAEYINIMDRAYSNSRLSGNFNPQTSLNQLDGVMATITREEAMATNTDWGKVISRTGSFVEANVSATQGTEKGSSYMSLRYRKDNSILKYSDWKYFLPMQI